MTESEQTQVGREESEPNRLSWDAIPLTTRAGIIPFLKVESCLSLDLSMTNHEARPHLVRSYKDMRSCAFDRYLYTEKDGFGALRWVMQRGIDLRGFRLEVGGRRGSGGILYELIWDGEVEIAEYYVTRGELHDVDEYKGRGTALVSAAAWGYLTIVKGLLDAGADMDKTDDGGGTPLSGAARLGHTEVVQALLDAGADMDKANDEGETPLYGAAWGGHIKVVQALVDAGADKDKADDGGWTPLYRAAWRGYIEVVQALLDAGADMDKADDEGETPLYGAAWEGHTKVVQALLDAGADWTKKTHEGGTALDIAKEKGRQEIALLLEQAGAS